MKKSIFIVIILMITACNNTSNKKVNDTENAVSAKENVGGQKDKHGCLSSVGETWSELRQACLQIFNEGTRLNPIQVEEGQAVISAFVLFNDNQSKVEIFLPETLSEKNAVLSKVGDNTYEADNLKYNSEKGELFIDGEVKYVKE